jgi:uncharacterized protein YecE (DUF72 family)
VHGMVEYYIGTMGFAYKDWAGSFYPPGVRGGDYLIHYAKVFNAVEIDSTFYGIPKRSSIARWKEQSPADFKLCLKVPRSITHEAKLVDVQREVGDFLAAVEPLDDKLGKILIQFPPSFDISNKDIFQSFLDQLPQPFEYAVEFRHKTWYTQETGEMLSRFGVCWVASEFPGVPKEVELTSNSIFIRLVGKHGRFASHDKERIDVTAQLAWWWQWIRSKVDRVHSVYVFVNDDYSGHAPASANRLKELIGLPVNKPDIPKQMKFL